MRLAWLCRFLLTAVVPVAADAASVTLDSPREYQVFQRSSVASGAIAVRGSAGARCDSVLARLDLQAWQPIPVAAPCAFDGPLAAPAGGWYRVEVRVLSGGAIVGEAVAEHTGVGEVFVVSGQSNSTNYGEQAQQTRSGMVSTFDGAGWRLANDPQPGVQDSSQLGSFLPAFGDALYAHCQVPVGVASVGSGSTSVRQWLPAGDRFPSPPTNAKFVTAAGDGQWESSGKLFDGMLQRIRQLGPHGFRAVLWHQGESDAHQGPGHEIEPAEYRRMMERLIREMRARAGWDFPWFVAQVSYHTPADTGAPEIRDAQAALWKEGLALQGPDSDTLTGEMRQNHGAGVHMSAAGLEAHGKLWEAKVAAWLDSIR
jgi:hypothetical protein